MNSSPFVLNVFSSQKRETINYKKYSAVFWFYQQTKGTFFIMLFAA